MKPSKEAIENAALALDPPFNCSRQDEAALVLDVGYATDFGRFQAGVQALADEKCRCFLERALKAEANLEVAAGLLRRAHIYAEHMIKLYPLGTDATNNAFDFCAKITSHLDKCKRDAI